MTSEITPFRRGFQAVPDFEHMPSYGNTESIIEATYEVAPNQGRLLRNPVATIWRRKKFFLPHKGSPHLHNANKVRITWQSLAAANPILRAMFVKGGKNGFQLSILKHVPANVDDDVDDEHTDCTESIFGKPPSIRIKDGENAIVLSIRYPVPLLDETSFVLLKNDFARFYYGGLPFENHLPYPKFLSYVLDRNDEAASRNFWRSQLENTYSSILPAIDPQQHLDTLIKPRAPGSITKKSIFVEGDEETLRFLKEIEQEEGFERRTLLQALWAIIVKRHCGADDHVVFSTSSRDSSAYGEKDTYSIVGHLDQCMPLKVTLDESRSVLEHLKEIEQVERDFARHAHIGYHDILATASHPIRIQTYIRTIGGGDTSSVTTCSTLDFPLRVVFGSENNRMRVSVWYEDTIALDKIRLLLEHFFALLEEFVQNPDCPIENLGLISPAEKHFMLRHARAFRREKIKGLVHGMFEKRVAKTPYAEALRSYEDGASTSFEDLNRMSNVIARRLMEKFWNGESGRGKFIAVCMEISVEMIAAVIGILKSGAAYVILDPHNPVERNVGIIQDINAECVITDDLDDSVRNVNVRELLDNASEEDGENPDFHFDTVQPEDPAYVIYTSGSTGKPKGVILQHSAAVSGITANTSLNTETRSLLFYNPIFSAAQRTILATLIKGGCLILARRDSLKMSLPDIIAGTETNTLGITSSTAALLPGGPEKFPNLANVTLTGEAIEPSLVRTWAGSDKYNVNLRNAYGLSEATQLNFGKRIVPGSNPRIVGRPRDTTSSYILLPGTTQLAPLLIPGELCLGGHQLSKGYLNREKDTRSKFVKNPFGPGMLYRTGDLAMCHESGEIEILGRIDFQVKINGQRVEPAEITAVLLQHSGVSEASVVAVTFGGKKHLVGSVVLKEHKDDNSKELSDIKGFLQKKIPSYMVPSFIVPVESIKKNANGKLDVPRTRMEFEKIGIDGLLQLSTGGREIEASEKILSAEEQILANIWGEILNVDIATISPFHSFAVLGGSSIQAIQAAVKASKSGIRVEVADIITAENLRAVAKTITTISEDDLKAPAPFSLLSEAESEPLKVKGIQDAFPVSALQESLLAAAMQGDTSYLYQRVYNVSDIVLPRLRNAFEKVFASSDLLRTTFISLPGSGKMIQTVRTDLKLPWTEVKSKSLETFKKEDLEKSVTLGEPFVRVAVVHGEGNNRYLVVSMHHVLFDFWSHGFLYEDVAKVYNGQEIQPRPSFNRFIRSLTQRSAEVDEAFWKEYLADASPSLLQEKLEAPTAVVSTTLSGTALKKFSSETGLTSGAIFYAAWSMVLSAQMQSKDVIFATTLSGRDVPIADIERLDGPTLTTVPQRVQITDDLTLTALVRAVQTNLWNMNKHSQVGMRKAMKYGAVDTQQGMVCDTLVNFLTPDQTSDATAKVFQRHGKRPVWQSEFHALEVQQERKDGEDVWAIRFVASLADKRRTQFILDEVITAVNAIVTTPDALVGDLDLVTGHELRFLENTVSPRTPDPEPQFLQNRFEQIAATEPDRVALQWLTERTVSYSELNKLANKLASHLSNKCNVNVGDVVPIVLDKSVVAIQSMLAILKTGAAYVPLSPEAPNERNNFIAEEVGAKVVLTEKAFAGIWEGTGVQVILIDEIDYSAEDGTVNFKPTSSTASTEDIAYLIYTSGSTGQPKGVMVPHRAAAAAVGSMIHIEGRDDGSEWRTLQFANYVFDASVQDIYNTLSSGGTLCMAPMATMLSDIVGTINLMKVRQAILTPTVAKLFKPTEVPTMVKLLLGGEPMAASLVEIWGGAENCELLNVYGPTETSMVVTTKNLIPGDIAKNVGAPFETVDASIRDSKGRYVPYGATGELCIGGPQVSHGYKNRPEMNAKTFITDAASKRMYRTGDVARWFVGRNDVFEVELFGRVDLQVKINGHRIELGEIEHTAVKYSEGHIRDCCVVVHKGALIAFCLMKPEEEIAKPTGAVYLPPNQEFFAGMLDKLTTGLTPYMRAKFWVPMASFPKNPSQKTDRKVLGAWLNNLDTVELSQYSAQQQGNANEPIIPPETNEEKLLQTVFMGLFGLEEAVIGKNSDFFSLGGDSIAAIQLVGILRGHGYKVSVPDVMEAPVLSEMATLLDSAVAEDHGSESSWDAIANEFETPAHVLDRIAEVGLNEEEDVEHIYPCPPGQAEFTGQGMRAGDEQYWTLMAIRTIPAEYDLERWIWATTELTRRNDILRSTYIHTPEYGWVQVSLSDSTLNLIRVTVGTPAEEDAAVEKFWDEKFTFGKPFIKYMILTLGDGTRKIAIKMNHSIYDGTLLRIFDDEFKAILEGGVSATTSNYSFKDFALGVHASNKNPSIKFYTNWLKEVKTVASPHIVPNPIITQFVVGTTDLKLEEIAHKHRLTIPILFQGAFQLYMASLSGNANARQFLFDCLVAGRNVNLDHIDNAQNVPGTCANFLPYLSPEVTSTTTVAQYLKSTQSLFWKSGGDYGNVGLDDIYNALDADRATYGNQVLFLFQPFDAATPGGKVNHDRFLVMAQSKVRMYQPYALVIEVAKTHTGGHKLRTMYDETCYTKAKAEEITAGIFDYLEKIAKNVEGKIEEILA